MLIRLGVLAVAFGAAAAVAFAAAPAAMRLDALTRIQNTIAHPPDASALERVRTYGLDPHDPDLARKLVPIEARARADAAATVAKALSGERDSRALRAAGERACEGGAAGPRARLGRTG